MTDEDFLDLIDLVKREMQDAGLSDFADDRNFFEEDTDRPSYLPRPKEHLLYLLKNFDALLARRSRNTFDDSLKRIQDSIEGDGPQSASIELATREGEESTRVLRLEAHDFGALRQSLQGLISQIAESEDQ